MNTNEVHRVCGAPHPELSEVNCCEDPGHDGNHQGQGQTWHDQPMGCEKCVSGNVITCGGCGRDLRVVDGLWLIGDAPSPMDHLMYPERLTAQITHILETHIAGEADVYLLKRDLLAAFLEAESMKATAENVARVIGWLQAHPVDHFEGQESEEILALWRNVLVESFRQAGPAVLAGVEPSEGC